MDPTPAMALSLSLQPIPLSLRLGCGAAVNGIRPATATAVGPSWATLQLGDLSQSPDLCRSPALQPKTHRTRWMALGAVAALVLRKLVP